jgi:hypothetical protein
MFDRDGTLAGVRVVFESYPVVSLVPRSTTDYRMGSLRLLESFLQGMFFVLVKGPHPNPSRREGQKKGGRVNPGRRLEDSPCPRLIYVVLTGL